MYPRLHGSDTVTLRALLVAITLLLALAVPTAAVTTGEDDAGAVTLAPHEGPNGQYATVDGGTLEVAFDELNDDAVTTADDVFTVTAGSDCVSVWVALDGVTVYRGGDPTNGIDSRSDAVVLDPGETVSVGVQFDSRTPVPDDDSLTVRADESDACDGSTTAHPVTEPRTTDAGPTPNGTATSETGTDDGRSSFDVDVSVTGTDDPAERTVAVTVENVGDAGGSYVATLTVDGTVVATRSVTVPAGESRTVEFTHRFGGAGRYDVGVGDQHRTVTVEGTAADLAVTRVAVDQRQLAPGGRATVTATVENTGDDAGETTVGLAVARAVVDSTTVTVPAGETRTVSFEWTFDTPGVYPIAVGGVDGGDVVVASGDTTSNRLLASALGTTLMPPLLVGLLLAVRRRDQLTALWNRR